MKISNIKGIFSKMLSYTVKREFIITLMTCIAASIIIGVYMVYSRKDEDKSIKVGIIYVGDASTAYTDNFIEALADIKEEYGDKVEVMPMYNVAEGTEREYLEELVNAGCDLIFSTSYNYGITTKEIAGKYPDVQFCMATCSNANEEPYLDNYHTFMGAIYEGRYAAGVAAGIKLKELIDAGIITENEAKIGYVGAYPYAEVISGYTAFLLGARSVVSQTTMTVKYTYKWNDYRTEKKYARELIDEQCIIISQHSDTAGPATACEETSSDVPVFNVSYNQSMLDVAPTTYLTGCKIDWKPYMKAAVDAVLNGNVIEKNIEGNINGNDVGAGFDEGWVSMLEFNDIGVADGTKEAVESVIEQLNKGKLTVFKGDYIGVKQDNPQDTIDLRDGYIENKDSSAPTFDYILKDIITIE